MKIGIVGAGHMGSTMARAFLAGAIVSPAELLLIESSEFRIEQLEQAFGCRVRHVIDAEIEECDVIILAVKPQEAQRACASLAPLLRSEQLVLSIMAGVTVAALRSWLSGHGSVVRSMPNLAAKARQAMTVFFVPPECSLRKAENVGRLLNTFGASLLIDDESLIDAATAISGTGPGYLFYIAEQMIAAAQDFGFSAEQARLLVFQTFKGSVATWEREKREPEELRALVTSKGGTTAAAISSFEEEGLADILKNGIKAALTRARELSRG